MRDQILHNLATLDGAAIQVLGSDVTYSYRALGRAISVLQGDLAALARRLGRPSLRVGLLMKNSPEWVCADLALLLGGHLEVPVPTEFTPAQARHLLQGVDLCIVEAELIESEMVAAIPREQRISIEMSALLAQAEAHGLDARPTADGADSTLVKAIHTSGTTSTPKGVLLSRRALETKVRTLAPMVGSGALERYLSLVPLSLLIEQICAIYLPLFAGGRIILLGRGETALTGGGRPASVYLAHLAEARPTFLTVPPAIVEAIHAFSVSAALSGPALSSAVFGREHPPLIACGGAPVSARTLEELEARGLVVYEGYGLSENASVVSWNLPGAYRLGTVGRPLPDCEVRLSSDGELLVRSPTLFSGYLNTDPGSCEQLEDGFLRTGDVAEIDAEGYIRISGRKKNIFINSAGRKVSAEWIESILLQAPEIRSAVVIGDRQPFPVALLLPQGAVPTSAMLGAIRRANRELPSYARVRNFAICGEGDACLADLVTVTGRPRRAEIVTAYGAKVEEMSGVVHPGLESEGE